MQDQNSHGYDAQRDRYGASRFAYFSEQGCAIIVFEAHDRRLHFDLPLPANDGEKDRQRARRRWRVSLAENNKTFFRAFYEDQAASCSTRTSDMTAACT